MSDPATTTTTATTIVVAVLASLPPTIAALASLFASKRNSAKADIIMGKTVEVHAMTNGNLSRVSKDLEVAYAEIRGLREQMTLLMAYAIIPKAPAEPTVAIQPTREKHS